MTKPKLGIMLIALLAVPFTAGFIVGLGTGGYYAEKPYIEEHRMITRKVQATNYESPIALSCAILAWSHDTPLDEKWWQQCIHHFGSSH